MGLVFYKVHVLFNFLFCLYHLEEQPPSNKEFMHNPKHTMPPPKVSSLNISSPFFILFFTLNSGQVDYSNDFAFGLSKLNLMNLKNIAWHIDCKYNHSDKKAHINL